MYDHRALPRFASIALLTTLKGCPKWRNEYGEKPIKIADFQEEIFSVGMPQEDPVFGKDGYLVRLWSDSPKAKL